MCERKALNEVLPAVAISSQEHKQEWEELWGYGEGNNSICCKNELNINVVGGYIKDGFKIYILTE